MVISQVERNRIRRSEIHRKNSGLQCLICGLFCMSVGNHVYRVHNITTREYKIQNDMYMSESLIAPILRKKRSDDAREGHIFTPEMMKKGLEGRAKIKTVYHSSMQRNNAANAIRKRMKGLKRPNYIGKKISLSLIKYNREKKAKMFEDYIWV